MNVANLDITITDEEQYKVLLNKAYNKAKESNHPSTHTAALLVNENEILLHGVNNLPPGVENKPERYQAKNKHLYPNHAERDVIYKAAKQGIKTQGLTMVMPWLPCIPCANAIITAGIKALVVHQPMIERTDADWVAELENAVQILHEAGVEIVAYKDSVGAKAYMHQEEWDA